MYTYIGDRDLGQAILRQANFNGVNLTTIMLPQDLSHCNFTNADFGETKLPPSVNFSNAILSGVDLRRVGVAGANFSGVNLTNTKLPTDLRNCNFTNANLSGVDLTAANVQSSTFAGAILTGTTLPRDLSGANFTGSQLGNMHTYILCCVYIMLCIYSIC